MENTQNEDKKTILITIIAGVLVLGGLVWWMNQTEIKNTSQQAKISSTPTPDVESSTINQEVDSIGVGSLNAEFEAIDKNLQEL